MRKWHSQTFHGPQGESPRSTACEAERHQYPLQRSSLAEAPQPDGAAAPRPRRRGRHRCGKTTYKSTTTNPLTNRLTIPMVEAEKALHGAKRAIVSAVSVAHQQRKSMLFLLTERYASLRFLLQKGGTVISVLYFAGGHEPRRQPAADRGDLPRPDTVRLGLKCKESFHAVSRLRRSIQSKPTMCRRIDWTR